MDNGTEMARKGNELVHGDQIEIVPPGGRRRIIKLNRTHYEFRASNSGNIEVDGLRIGLPGPLPKNFLCHLKLYSKEDMSKEQAKQSYLLSNLSGFSFNHNGNDCLQSFLDRNDRVYIGLNEVICQANKNDRQAGFYDETFFPQKVLESHMSILLTGETGVGKSHLAKKIHEESGRPGKFVHLNLSSFSEQLIESEIFGHVKGAFTGAHKDKRGAILEAHYGTLFIDEIDSLPFDIQTKLLLFLDSKEFRHVGGSGAKKVDVRLIFAAGRELTELVAEKKFRKDLYFRVESSMTYHIPPLRERPKFIAELLSDFCFKHHLNYSQKLLLYYQDLKWPGNIRQFLSHLEKKKFLTKGKKLFLDNMDLDLVNSGQINELDCYRVGKGEVISLAELQGRYIWSVYKRVNEKVEVSAKLLGVSPTTVRSKLRKIRKSEAWAV